LNLVKLDDAYFRELLTRLDGQSSNNPSAAVVESSTTAQREALNRAEAERALELRLNSLRQQLSSISDEKPNANEKPNTTLYPPAPQSTGEFVPLPPNTLEEVGLTQEEIESLTLKYVLNRVTCPGRQIAEQLGLSFSLMERVLFTMKADQLVVQKGSAPLSDYVYQLTAAGLEEARRRYKQCSYFGYLPVPLEDYIASVNAQSVRGQQPSPEQLEAVFHDLLVDEQLRTQIGQAIFAGKGFFLYGAPGNGKTSLAERVARAFGQYIWIPRAIGIAGEIIRLFDPCNHQEAPAEDPSVAASRGPIDRRWIRICRPTVISGGELTMDRLEIATHQATGINEAPLQLKSNCGVLVIDDFGRQRMAVAELLNRWIVPLDRGYDFLTLPSGKTIQVPFNQLLVFSTNLEPRELVDEAFLRRISYKIEVPDPKVDDFRELMQMYAVKIGCAYDESAVEHLISQHFFLPKRQFRACHARDLLDHVRHYCGYHRRELAMSHEAFDAAVKNYFGLMG
jgi:DNA-binding MarR family transcriptional regulator